MASSAARCLTDRSPALELRLRQRLIGVDCPAYQGSRYESTRANTLEDFGVKLAEVPEPVIRERDVLVEVHAIGLNPGEAFIRIEEMRRQATNRSDSRFSTSHRMPDVSWRVSGGISRM